MQRVNIKDLGTIQTDFMLHGEICNLQTNNTIQAVMVTDGNNIIIHLSMWRLTVWPGSHSATIGVKSQAELNSECNFHCVS